ncbi:FeoA family protein [Sporofaciens sp. SGI.106]|uniref:FeoA family protein n=1 Tax=Sporofaciens sp. SGI.106 TaxID=3420568 RepID=UPI002AA02176|nr:FeoA family protein [Lachnoclostridium sp.]
MTLKQGENHHTYEVQSIQIELQLERRLEALGLTEGSLITILNNDKRGAMTVKFRGTRFALGRRIAENIQVKEAARS